MNNTNNIKVLSFNKFKSNFFDVVQSNFAPEEEGTPESAEESASEESASEESAAEAAEPEAEKSEAAPGVASVAEAASGKAEESSSAAEVTSGEAEASEAADIQETIADLFNSPSSTTNYTIQINNNKHSIKINDKNILLDDLIKYMQANPNTSLPLKKAIKQYVQSKNTNASNLSFDTKKFLFNYIYPRTGGGKKKLSKKLFIKNKKQTKKHKLTNK